MYSLRYYQQDGIDQMREAFRRHRRVLYYGPTGSGKTVTFAALAMLTALKGKSVCILVHRIELLEQACDKLTEFGVEHNVIASGLDSHRNATVTVASKDTLRMRDFREFDLLVIDEAHHAPAKTYRKIMDHAKYVLGVSASPIRMTGTGLKDIFDVLILGPSVRQLTPEFLAPCTLYAPPVPVDLSGLRVARGDYVQSDLASRMLDRTITGDAVAHYKRYLDRKPVIAFCVSVEHAYQVATEFAAAGYNAVGVDGKLDKDTRKTRIRGLADGTVDILCSCQLVDEGLDVPGVWGILDLRPTRSLGRCLQGWGRAMRLFPGKEQAIILDFVGNVWRHGLPADEREWSLEHGVIKKKQEQKDRIRQCPMCYYTHELEPFCPNCGYLYPKKSVKPPKKQAGELVAVTTYTPEERKHIQHKAKSLDELTAVERKLGYKHGWAWLMAKRKGYIK